MLETLAVGWFGLGELPTLSLGRVNHWQLECALGRRRDHTVRTRVGSALVEGHLDGAAFALIGDGQEGIAPLLEREGVS
jgi:hypothetical protein